MNYGWRFVTLYRRQGSRPSPRKRNAKNKMAVWGGLTNSCEKKRGEKQRRKGKIEASECRVPKNSKKRSPFSETVPSSCWPGIMIMLPALLLHLLSHKQVDTQKGAQVSVRWDHVRRAVPGTR